MKKKYVYALIVCITVFFIGEASVQYSSQPPFNYTGAEGSTCAQCHSNFNTGGGSISTSGLPAGGFVEGQDYNFSITIAHPTTRGRWGFSIGARDANNQSVGTFSDSNPNASPNVDELSHFMAVFETGNTYTYNNLKWTAPVNPTNAQKSVTFYYIGNAANGDRGLTGDFIYSGTKTAVLIPPNQPPVVSITNPVNNSTFAAGSLVSVEATASDTDGFISKVEFYNDGIKFFEDSTAPYGLVSSNEIEPGNYTLTARAYDNGGDSTVSDTVRLTVTGCTPVGVVTGEGYVNIPGTQVADLLNNPAYPGNPGITVPLGSLEYNGVGSNYGTRLSGYICAPITGNYVFYIAGDDQAGLFLSTDANPANKALVAYNETPVGFRDWFRFPTQQSAPIRMVKGARYYFETLHKQSTGSDYLSVGWTKPDGTSEAPVPGSRLSPIEVGSSHILKQSFQQAMQELQLPTAGKLVVKATPNPSDSYFTITTNSSSDMRLNIRLTDMQGRIVERRTNIAANGTLQLGSRLPAGVYFLEVTQGSQRQRFKLVRR